jgi:hypothetical protein
MTDNTPTNPDPTATDDNKTVDPVGTPAPAVEPAKADPAPESDKQPEPDKTPEPTKTDPTPEPIEDYPEYDDANANAVVAVLKEAGVTAQESHEAFEEAVKTGDFSKAKMDTLVAKLGAEKANLVMLGVKAYYDAQTGPVKESVQLVYAEVGGDQNWQKIATWARTKADADPAFAKDVEAYNQMLDLNKTAAAIAARELMAKYNADPRNSSLVKTQIMGDKAASTSGGLEYISRADYIEQLKEAELKRDTVAIQHLNARRKASLNQ